MAEQLDNRPVFTVVLGGAGAGKTAWKREELGSASQPLFRLSLVRWERR